MNNEEDLFVNQNEEKTSILEKSNEIPIIDQIHDKYGYSSLVWINIISTFLILFIEDIEMTYFSYLLIPYSALLKLTKIEIIFIHSIFYIGSGLGSTNAAFVTKYFSRRIILNISILILTLCHFGGAFVKNVYLLCVLRFFNGFSVGVMDIITITVLAEYLPSKFRAFVLTFIWIAFSISPTIFLWIMLYVMPLLEPNKIQDLLVITSSFPLVCLLYNLIFFNDSPRSFILNGQNEEGLKILETMNGSAFTADYKNKLVDELNTNANQNIEGTIYDLYNSKYLSTTLILFFFWLSSGIVCYGILLISSLTMESTNVSASDIIKNEIYIRIPSAVSYFIGAPLSEVKCMGRIRLLIILNSACVLFIIISVFCTGSVFSWMLGISFAINFLNLNISNTYACEIYPTKIRDQAIGALFTGSNVGAVLSLVVIPLHSMNIWMPYYFGIGLYLISTVSLFFLPFEVTKEYLDFIHRDEEISRKKD